MKFLRIFFFLSLAAAPVVFGDTETAAESDSHRNENLEATRAEITGLVKLAITAVDRNNPALAETFYERMLNVQAPDAEKRDGLLQMGSFYEDQKSAPKAIAVYEKFFHLFPRDPRIFDVLLKLGILYRETGAYQLAISRFYSVLNSVLKVQEADLAAYKSATLKAQFEIADTYFLAADYEQASKYFKLITLLDLKPVDRARVHFKTLYCQFLLGDYAATINLAETFLKDFEDSPKRAECRYILATSLKATSKPKDALEQVLALLRSQKAREEKDPQAWTYWQKKTGNQFANEFYQQGDFVSALTIYQSLAKLNNAPDWQWPVIFQMGLCFERLRLPARALEAYTFIMNESKKPEVASTLSPALASLREMAQWHVDELQWKQTTEAQLHSLLGSPQLPDDLKISSIP